ncbi:hypothetical protein FI667_g5824, partial [Globisporangium splendens]
MLALRHAARRASSLRHSHVSLRAAMSTASSDKKFYVLQYQYTPDILEKRDSFRSEHLARIKTLKAEDKLLMAGAFVDPTDAAVFIFSTADKRDIDDFVKNDPYVKNNLVVSHTIREWNVVVRNKEIKKKQLRIAFNVL